MNMNDEWWIKSTRYVPKSLGIDVHAAKRAAWNNLTGTHDGQINISGRFPLPHPVLVTRVKRCAVAFLCAPYYICTGGGCTRVRAWNSVRAAAIFNSVWNSSFYGLVKPWQAHGTRSRRLFLLSLVPVVLPSSPCCYLHPLTLEPDSHPLTRLDGRSRISFSCIVLFPIAGRWFATARVSLPTYNHLFRFPFSLRCRHPPTRVPLPILPEYSPLSKYYFLHGDKCKTKTYLFYTLLFCKYAGIATGPDLFLPLSFFLLLAASTFAIFLTIVHI